MDRSGKVIYAKGGTQIIDRAWGQLRNHMGTRSVGLNTTLTDARVRSAQWAYWNRGLDLFKKTGEMLRDLLQ